MFKSISHHQSKITEGRVKINLKYCLNFKCICALLQAHFLWYILLSSYQIIYNYSVLSIIPDNIQLFKQYMNNAYFHDSKNTYFKDRLLQIYVIFRKIISRFW